MLPDIFLFRTSCFYIEDIPDGLVRNQLWCFLFVVVVVVVSFAQKGNWYETAKQTRAPPRSGNHLHGRFGHSCAIVGSHLAVGQPGKTQKAIGVDGSRSP